MSHTEKWNDGFDIDSPYIFLMFTMQLSKVYNNVVCLCLTNVQFISNTLVC
jgi:hypothetical protein